MPATPSGADALANTLLTSLTVGKDFTLPEFDFDDPVFDQPDETGSLYDEVPKIAIADLTTGQVDGSGVFDKIMSSLVRHLKVEYESNRISGAEYTKAYIGVIGAALQAAQNFVLGKDQAYWQALLVQAQARTAEIETTRARIDLETARAMLARTAIEAANAEATYALTKLKISTEDITYANMQLQGVGIGYTNTNLQKQGLQIDAQTDLVEAQTTKTTTETSNLVSQKVGIDFTNSNILPQQEKLLKEQVEVQRAQTSETRTDGPAVAGAVGKQKELYGQQIISYQRDAELKGAKIWSDAWITQKTIDEGLLAPNQFTNANLDTVLSTLRTNLDL